MGLLLKNIMSAISAKWLLQNLLTSIAEHPGGTEKCFELTLADNLSWRSTLATGIQPIC